MEGTQILAYSSWPQLGMRMETREYVTEGAEVGDEVVIVYLAD
jgi:hypothetical protein